MIKNIVVILTISKSLINMIGNFKIQGIKSNFIKEKKKKNN